jgi:hypothetical protein
MSLKKASRVLEERSLEYPPFPVEADRVCKALKILWDIDLTPEQYTKVLVTMKLCREGKKHKADNITDGINYLGFLASILGDDDV